MVSLAKGTNTLSSFFGDLEADAMSSEDFESFLDLSGFKLLDPLESEDPDGGSLRVKTAGRLLLARF